MVKNKPSQPPAAPSPILNGPYEAPAWHYATADDGSLDYERPMPGRRIFTAHTPQVPLGRQPQGSLYDVNDFVAEYRDQLVNLVREQVQLYKEEPELYDLLAKAYADQGKMTLQHMALAESYVLQGATMAALDQLTIARKSTDATFYDQAVIDARERELQEKRREQIKDQKG